MTVVCYLKRGDLDKTRPIIQRLGYGKITPKGRAVVCDSTEQLDKILWMLEAPDRVTAIFEKFNKKRIGVQQAR